MVRHAKNINAIGLEMLLVLEQLRPILDPKGDVLHPRRRIGIAAHLGLGRQLEEGEHVALSRVEENVHVGIGLLGGGNQILGDGQHEVHAQHFLVPEHGFLRVATAIRNVVNAIYLHGHLLCPAPGGTPDP